MVKCLYSVFAFLPVFQCLCIHTVYIYKYLYILSINSMTVLKCLFLCSGRLCSAPQPPQPYSNLCCCQAQRETREPATPKP